MVVCRGYADGIVITRIHHAGLGWTLMGCPARVSSGRKFRPTSLQFLTVVCMAIILPASAEYSISIMPASVGWTQNYHTIRVQKCGLELSRPATTSCLA